MAKASPKSTRERAFESALSLAPAPIRTIASNPIGMRLLMVVGSILMATGILTMEWKDGKPHFNFHRDKAQEVRKELVEDIKEGVNSWEQERGIPQTFSGQTTYPNAPAANGGYPAQAQVPQGYFVGATQQAAQNYPQAGYPQTGYPQTGYPQTGYPNGYPANANYPAQNNGAPATPTGWGQPQQPQGGYYQPSAPGYPPPGTQGQPGYPPTNQNGYPQGYRQ